MYFEAITLDSLKEDLRVIFGGSYVDKSGKLNIVATAEITEETKLSVCNELGVSKDVVTFVKGKYTLEYLTELQEKISAAMADGELPFVVSSAIYENINRIVVGVTDDSEENINKLTALDELGGAIMVEASEKAFTDMLPASVN